MIKIFALGGLNETGKNMYVVEVDKDIFVFDAGMKFNFDMVHMVLTMHYRIIHI